MRPEGGAPGRDAGHDKGHRYFLIILGHRLLRKNENARVPAAATRAGLVTSAGLGGASATATATAIATVAAVPAVRVGYHGARPAASACGAVKQHHTVGRDGRGVQ